MSDLGDALQDTEAHARRGDPDTSHDAATSVGDTRKSQQDVWWVLAVLGPMTDEALVDTVNARALSTVDMQSPSGLRSRRAELVRLGFVEDTGERAPMRTGRMARVWRAV